MGKISELETKLRVWRNEHIEFMRLTMYIIAIIFMYLFYSIGFKFIENVTWEEAFWQSWQTMTTVGYGNKPAETIYGRIFTILTCTIGIALLGAAFSEIFEIRGYLRERRRLGLTQSKIKDGYVIFNCPPANQLANFINEIREAEKQVGICIVDSTLEKLPGDIGILPDIHFVKGNYYDKETYVKSNLINNKTVIIFPADPGNSNSDGITRAIVDLVANYSNKSVRIIHVLVDKKNAWMFDGSLSTQIPEGIQTLSIVQECQDTYSSLIIDDLYTNIGCTNIQTAKPKLIIGWRWKTLVEASLFVSEKDSEKINLLGIIKKNRAVDTCPLSDTELEENDTLAFIASNTFCWDEFEKELIKVRT